MLSLETLSLDNILSKGKINNDREGLGYSRANFSSKGKSTVFIRATNQQTEDDIPESSITGYEERKKYVLEVGLPLLWKAWQYQTILPYYLVSVVQISIGWEVYLVDVIPKKWNGE